MEQVSPIPALNQCYTHGTVFLFLFFNMTIFSVASIHDSWGQG